MTQRVPSALRTDVHGDAVVVRLEGDHDVANAGALRSELLAAVERASARLVVDTTACTLLDSIGLGVLLQVNRAATARGKDVVLVASSEPIVRTMQLTQLDRVWSVLPSVDAALAAGTARP